MKYATKAELKQGTWLGWEETGGEVQAVVISIDDKGVEIMGVGPTVNPRYQFIKIDNRRIAGWHYVLCKVQPV